MIELKRLIDAKKSDIIELMNHPKVLNHMPLAQGVFDEAAYEAFITAKEQLWKQHGYGPWAFFIDGRFAGWGGLQYEEGDADLALVLHPNYWGHGKAVYNLIRERSFGEMGFFSITALLPPSRVHLSAMNHLGFERDGKLRIDGQEFWRFRLSNNKLDTAVTEAMKDAHVPGAALLLIRDGQIKTSRTFGLADPETGRVVSADTLFTIASCSKPVTATALMTLYDQGKLALDEDINSYLPFRIKHPNPISFRHLLSHTSTICDSDKFWDYYTLKQNPVLPDSPIPLGDFLKDYLNAEDSFLNEIPGAKYAYSNAGFGLIGFLVECISKMPFGKYCRQAIFEPLGMKNTAWHFRDVNLNLMAVPYGYNEYLKEPIRYGFYGYPTYPDGALKTSVNEFARFLSIFINDGKSFDGTSILRPETVKEMLTSHSFLGMDSGETVGLAWHFNGEVYHHDGGDPGISTVSYFSPATRMGLIFFCNGSDFDIVKPALVPRITLPK